MFRKYILAGVIIIELMSWQLRSYIPESTWSHLSTLIALPPARGSRPVPQENPLTPPKPPLLALVIDVTGLKLGSSHFGLPQSLATARRLGPPQRTYFTDLPHATSHECWLHFCEQYERGHNAKDVPWTAIDVKSDGNSDGHTGNEASPKWKAWTKTDQQPSMDAVYRGFDPLSENYELFTERAVSAIEEWDGGRLAGPRPWCRPARDGMTISWYESDDVSGKAGYAWDDEYH